jgi:hypothetical protein
VPTWPLPGCKNRKIPGPGETGSFWEDRGDRRHCGIDLHAPEGSSVAAIFAGTVLGTGIQTSPDTVVYWNRTLYALLKGDDGTIIRYAELGKLRVEAGDRIEEGRCIGAVGAVLNPSRIDEQAPAYIRRLGAAGASSMLHLEVYAALPPGSGCCTGGNWFGRKKPAFLFDPTELLRDAGGG